LYTRHGANQADEGIELSVDEQEQSFRVCWYGLCGYSMVVFSFAHEGQAVLFFEAALNTEEYEVD
jgi:hypothetical protein